MVTRAVVPTNSTKGICHSAPLSTTYTRTCTVDIATLSVIGSNATFQIGGYVENLSIYTFQILKCNFNLKYIIA
jgi:hypothetical protein